MSCLKYQAPPPPALVEIISLVACMLLIRQTSTLVFLMLLVEQRIRQRRALYLKEEATIVLAYVQSQKMCTPGKYPYLKFSYENYCPTDFSTGIFMNYFWGFCKAHASNLPFEQISITGIPIVGTVAASSSAMATSTTSVKHSFFPSSSQVSMDYFSIWIISVSIILSFGVMLI
jgi:hypothetical protein